MTRRHNYFINKPFQLKMILYSLILIGPVICLIYYSSTYFIKALILQLENMGDCATTPLIKFILEAQSKLQVLLLIISAIFILFNTFFFLILSHSIAGPIDKLKSYLEKRIKNEPIDEPFNVRKNDFFTELPELVNKAFQNKTED